MVNKSRSYELKESKPSIGFASVDVEMVVTLRSSVSTDFPSQLLSATRALHLLPITLADQFAQPLHHHGQSNLCSAPVPSPWPRPILLSRLQACPKKSLNQNRPGSKPRSSASSPKPLLRRQPPRQVKNALKREVYRSRLLRPARLARKRLP